MMANLVTSALAFNGPALRAPARASGVEMGAKSKAIPFLEARPALAGWVGDAGFDPLGFSTVNMLWMREAEIKHSRLAMLATAGWVAVDLGARFPGAGADYTAVPSSLAAHDAMVSHGDMYILLILASIIETVALFGTMQMIKGETDRKPGDFYFDPMNMAKGKDSSKMATNEIKNGRLAMVAFSGIVTQAALGHASFPYFGA
mmetsp:Transcript_41062/g.101327  ORF Transcript_41062/g.101327 Transcript_41062/m.101327 type:complete len:203 (-) Transcript_41062:167-775(-)